MGRVLELLLVLNFIMIASFLAVWTAEYALKHTRLRYAYKLRLNLSIAALCAAFVSLVVLPIIAPAKLSFGVNVTDVVVAQYLKGNIAISATQLAELLTAKNSLMDNLTGLSSPSSLVLAAALALAGLLRAGYVAISAARLIKIVSNARPLRSCGRLNILVSNRITIAFSSRGLTRYHIVLPDTFLSDREAMRMALGHEIQHIRQRDVDWEILLSLLSPLLVLNPAFWFISDRIRRYREYSCDAAFLARKNFHPRRYALLLLELATRAAASPRNTRLGAMSVPLFGLDPGRSGRSPRGFKKSALGRRVLALSNRSANDGRLGNSGNRYLDTLLAVSLISLIVVVVTAFSRPSEWSHDRLMLSSVVNLERLDRINGFGVPPLR